MYFWLNWCRNIKNDIKINKTSEIFIVRSPKHIPQYFVCKIQVNEKKSLPIRTNVAEPGKRVHFGEKSSTWIRNHLSSCKTNKKKQVYDTWFISSTCWSRRRNSNGIDFVWNENWHRRWITINHAYFRYEFVCYKSERSCACACALKSSVPHWHAILGYDIRAMDFGSKVHCSLWIKATEEKKTYIYWNKSCSTRLKSKSRLDVWRDTFNTFAHLRKFFLFHFFKYYWSFDMTILRQIPFGCKIKN